MFVTLEGCRTAKRGRHEKLSKTGSRDQVEGPSPVLKMKSGRETKHVTIVIEEVVSSDTDEDDVDF